MNPYSISHSTNAPMPIPAQDLQVALETPRSKKGRRRKATLEQRVARFAAKEALQLLERLQGSLTVNGFRDRKSLAGAD